LSNLMNRSDRLLEQRHQSQGRSVPAKQILQVNTAADSIRRTLVGQVLGELKQGHKRQPPQAFRRPAASGEEGRELGVSENRLKPVAQEQIGIATGKAGRATDAVEAGASPLTIGRSDIERLGRGPKPPIAETLTSPHPLQPIRQHYLNRSKSIDWRTGKPSG
jgi:hypothetical protein